MDQTFSLVLERRGAEGRFSVAKIMSIKKGSLALMVNVDKGREGVSFSGNFDDIKCQRSLNKWMIPKETRNMKGNWRLISARRTAYNHQFLVMRIQNLITSCYIFSVSKV